MTLKILTKIGKIILGVLGLLGIFLLSILISVYYFTPKIQKTSFLFLGVSGPGHDSPTLTDTMIFSSFSSKGTTMISIPRDIWYQPAQAKINTLYYYGQKNGSEMNLVKQGVFDIIGQTVDNWVIINFTTFQKVIDWVDGIEVYVEQTFDDYQYPIAGKENDLCGGDKEYKCRYEHIRFEKGWQLMNGETALKFVRSRNAEGDEGTDTARSKRQEKVISALKTKILSVKFLFNVQSVRNAWRIFQEGVKTDIAAGDILPISKLFISASTKKINSYILDGWESKDGFLYNPKTHPSGQWVLLPRGDSWGKIHEFVKCFIGQENKSSCFPTGK